MIFALASAVAAITVTVPETASVRGQDLHVSSIVRVEGAEASDRARIEALTLGYTPSPGYGRVITRDEIATRLRAALPDRTVSVLGAERCRVEVETETVTGASVQAQALTALRKATEGLDVAIAAATPIADLVVPHPESRLELRPSVDVRALRSGNVSVPVQVWIDGAPYQTVQAPLLVELYRNVPVVVADVGRGQPLSASVVNVERRLVDAGLPGEPLVWQAVNGSLALRDLRAGTIVTDRDVQRALLVKRGDVVQIQVRKGGIVARSTATAAQDGYLGDRVRVTTADARRELTAVVTGRSSVELDLGGTP